MPPPEDVSEVFFAQKAWCAEPKASFIAKTIHFTEKMCPFLGQPQGSPLRIQQIQLQYKYGRARNVSNRASCLHDRNSAFRIPNSFVAPPVATGGQYANQTFSINKVYVPARNDAPPVATGGQYANQTFAVNKTSVPARNDAPLYRPFQQTDFSKGAPGAASRCRLAFFAKKPLQSVKCDVFLQIELSALRCYNI